MSDDKLDKIESKLDKINDRLSAIDVTLASQHETLKEHVKRSTQLEDRMVPVEKHVTMVHGVTKFLMYLSGMAALIAAVIKALK